MPPVWHQHAPRIGGAKKLLTPACHTGGSRIVEDGARARSGFRAASSSARCFRRWSGAEIPPRRLRSGRKPRSRGPSGRCHFHTYPKAARSVAARSALLIRLTVPRRGGTRKPSIGETALSQRTPTMYSARSGSSSFVNHPWVVRGNSRSGLSWPGGTKPSARAAVDATTPPPT